MKFTEWLQEQIDLNEQALPQKIKTLKTKLEKELSNTPLIVAADKGRVAVLTPSYDTILDVGYENGSYVMKKDKSNEKFKNEKEVLSFINTAIEAGAVF